VIDPSALIIFLSHPGAVDERVEGRVSARQDERQIDSALGRGKGGGWLEVEG
jgi:hypothetical protein